MQREKLLCPSILNLKMDGLRDEIIALDKAGTDIFHLDIMDGSFVPNFGMSFADIDVVRQATDKLIDCHMMVQDPIRYVDMVAEHGCDIIYIHAEADPQPPVTLARIHTLGKKAGIVINPGTSLASVQELYPLIDYFMVMAVNPGFCGQPYLDFVEPKIEQLVADRKKWGFHIVIDGGVDATVLKRLYQKGVEGFVLGNLILFKQQEDYAAIMNSIRKM